MLKISPIFSFQFPQIKYIILEPTRFPKQIHIVNYLNHLKTLRGSFESLLTENGGANDRLRKENHEVRSVRKYSKFLGCEPPCSPIGKQTEIDRKGSVKLD